MRKAPRVDTIAALALVCVAAFFRFYHLHEVPIGLWRDEAANGLEALNVLGGAHAIFFGTREPMFIYLVAVSVAFLGRNALAIRIVAAILGTITIPVAYVLVRELFRSTDQESRPIACLTSVWLATSYWHLNFSRLGFRGILLPLLSSSCFYFFWRGWNELDDTHQTASIGQRHRLVWFGLAGVFLGLTMYTYTPSRLLPLVVLPFAGLVAGSRRRKGSPRPRAHDAHPDSTPPLIAVAVFAIAFLLVFAPLGMYFLSDSGSFLVRSGVSVFSAPHAEPMAVVLIKNTLRQLGMFGFLADPNTRHDPAGRPAFDLLTLLFFLIGFAVSLRRWRQLPYVFSVAWFLVMLLPAILTYPELPHFLRAIGALPVAYVFPALGLHRAWLWIGARWASHKARSALVAVIALCFILVGSLTYRDYFNPAVEEIELIKAFDPRFVKAASIMNQLDEPHSVWIIPLGPRGEQRMAYYVIDFLYQGNAPHHYVKADEATVAQQVSEICRGKQRAMVLRTTEEYASQPWFDLYVDSNGLILSLLDRYAQRLESVQVDGFEVITYQLPTEPILSIAQEFEPQ
jgi:hypothetical protein